MEVSVEASRYLENGEVLHRNERGAGLLILMDGGVAVKLFPSKGRVATTLRGLIGQSKAHKQWRAAQKILNIGLRTPKPIGVEEMKADGEYESAFLYEYLEKAESLRERLFHCEGAEKEGFLRRMAGELVTMAKAGVLFIDFHLGNVLVDDEGELWWIDPEVKVSHGVVRKKFWSRIERMYAKCDGDVLSEEDFTFLKARLVEGLREAGMSF